MIIIIKTIDIKTNSAFIQMRGECIMKNVDKVFTEKYKKDFFSFIKKQDKEKVVEMIDSGMDVSVLDSQKNNVLMYAINTHLANNNSLIAENYNITINKKSHKENVDLFGYLLNMGAQIAHRNESGSTVLSLLIKYRNREILNFLLKNKKIGINEFYILALNDAVEKQNANLLKFMIQYGLSTQPIASKTLFQDCLISEDEQLIINLKTDKVAKIIKEVIDYDIQVNKTKYSMDNLLIDKVKTLTQNFNLNINSKTKTANNFDDLLAH
jgi:hypothetical protein